MRIGPAVGWMQRNTAAYTDAFLPLESPNVFALIIYCAKVPKWSLLIPLQQSGVYKMFRTNSREQSRISRQA